MRLLIAITVALLVGCAASAPPAGPIVLCKNLQPAARMWQIEARQRFRDPVLVVVHGGDRDGTWYCFPDAPLRPMPVYAVAQTIQAAFPGRPIILLCCNRANDRLDVAGVYHAHGIVWCTPDAWRLWPIPRGPGAGSIADFDTDR